MKPILLISIKPLTKVFIAKINNYLKNMFNIEPPDIRTATVFEVKNYGVDKVIQHYSLIITNYYAWSEDMHFLKKFTPDKVGELIAGIKITVKGEWTDDLEIAKQWLSDFDKNNKILALDLETDNLTLPQFQNINMIGLGYSTTESKAIIFKDDKIRQYVLNWVVNTDITFIAHNAGFDFYQIYYHTKKMPKHLIEDTELLARVYHNHVITDKRKVSLKHLAKNVYSDWAEAKESFELYLDHTGYENDNLTYVGNNTDIYKYNLSLIYYLLYDITATTFLYKKYTAIEKPNNTELIFPTSEPRDNLENFNRRDYYEYVAKPALPFIIEMKANGQSIDISKVKTLEEEIANMKKKELSFISEQPSVIEFQKIVDQKRIDKFKQPVINALKFPNFIKYQNNVEIRTFIIAYHHPEHFNLTSHLDIDFTKHKITAKDLKELNYPITEILLNKDYENPLVIEAVNQYAWYKASTNNIKMNRIDKIQNPEKYNELGFNPYNYVQLSAMWEFLGLESDEISKETGKMSFASKVLKEIEYTLPEGEIKDIVNSYLEISKAKNIVTQYIPKYYGSTIDDRVYNQFKLLGTLTA
jgi:hypothetical protein